MPAYGNGGLLFGAEHRRDEKIGEQRGRFVPMISFGANFLKSFTISCVNHSVSEPGAASDKMPWTL